MKNTLVLIFGIICIIGGLSITAYHYMNDDTPMIEQQQDNSMDGLIEFEKWAEEQQAKKIVEQEEQKEKEEKIITKDITVFLAGDVMLSRGVESTILKKNDFNYPFLLYKDIISKADIAFANLESPIFEGAVVPTGSFVFRADPRSVDSMEWAGFDILGLANNHILNKGEQGLLNTFEELDDAEIGYCGAAKNSSEIQNFYIKEVNGLKIGFLCYAYGPDYYAATKNKAGMVLTDIEQLKSDLAKIKEQVDFSIVSMHAGIEYRHNKSDDQERFAYAAIDNGAELVIGHHPHVVQEAEIYKNKYIFYSLGNFVFDQMWSDETKQGVALEVKINEEGVYGIMKYPYIIEDYAQPRPATESEAEIINGYLGLEDTIIEDKEF